MMVDVSYPIIPADKPCQCYIDLDGIRLIVMYGEIIGWYRPDSES